VFSSVLLNTIIWGALPVFAYLLGSIPWGLVLTRLFTSTDIRKQGSGNIGATNVSRVAGTTLGLLTFAGDILKGAIPVFLATHVTNPGKESADAFLGIVALAALLGHLFPIFTKLKGGGKGVATAAGCFIVLSPPAGLIAVSAFIICLFVSRRVSVGSLAAAAVLPVAVWLTAHSFALTVCAVITGLLIILRHSDNIKRLRSGVEPEFRERK
jgi:glycerol-3-phosphate acyltransferase PlsY